MNNTSKSTINENKTIDLIGFRLKKYIVYMIVLTQITMPTLQAYEFHFEIEKVEQRQTQYNNLLRPALSQINLKINFHGISDNGSTEIKKIYDQNIDFQINGGDKANKFISKLSLKEPMKYMNQPIVLKGGNEDSINVHYNFDNTIFDFSFNHAGQLTINYLRSENHSFFFKCFDNITLALNQSRDQKISSSEIRKDHRDDTFNIKGLTLISKTDVTNNVKIYSNEETFIKSNGFVNNKELRSNNGIDIDSNRVINNKKESIIHSENALKIHNGVSEIDGKNVLNNANYVMNMGRMTSKENGAIHADAIDNDGLIASTQQININGKRFINHENGMVGLCKAKKLCPYEKRVDTCKEIIRDLGAEFSTLKEQTKKNALHLILTQALTDIDKLFKENNDLVSDSLESFMDKLAKKMSQVLIGKPKGMRWNPLEIYKNKKNIQSSEGKENDSAVLLNEFLVTPEILLNLEDLQNKGVFQSTLLTSKTNTLTNENKILAQTATIATGTLDNKSLIEAIKLTLNVTDNTDNTGTIKGIDSADLNLKDLSNNSGEIYGKSLKLQADKLTNDIKGVIDAQTLELLKSPDFNNKGIVQIKDRGVLEIEGTNSGKILSAGSLSLSTTNLEITDTGLIDTKLMTLLRAARLINRGEILIEEAGLLEISGENYGKIHSQSLLSIKILERLLNHKNASIMTEKGILNFLGETGILESLGELSSRTEINFGFLCHLLNKNLIKSEIISGFIRTLDNHNQIDGVTLLDLTISEVLTNFPDAHMTSENKISLKSETTNNEGNIHSKKKTSLIANQKLTNTGDILGENTLSVVTPVFDHDLKGSLHANIFSFIGQDLLLKGKTFFEDSLTAIVTGVLDYITPEPTSPTDKPSSTLSAKNKVDIRLLKGKIDKKIHTPAALEISLLPESQDIMVILADIITEKGTSLKSGTQILDFGDIGGIAPKVQTRGPLTLQGRGINLINAALAAKGKIQATAADFFMIGCITPYQDGSLLYYQNNGTSLATADFLEIETKLTNIFGATLLSRKGSKIQSPSGFSCYGGYVHLDGNAVFKTAYFHNQIAAFDLASYLSRGGQKEKYATDCLSRAPRAMFWIGGDLNFEGLESGENKGSDFYVGGIACPETTKILHTKYYGVPQEFPAIFLNLDPVFLKNRKRLIKRGVPYPSVDEISQMIKRDRKAPKHVVANRLIQDRQKNGTPEGFNNNFYVTKQEIKIVKFLHENELYHPFLREIKTLAILFKKKHHKGAVKKTIPLLRKERAARSQMIIEPTFSAGKSITLDQKEGLLQIMCSIQAPNIDASFQNLIVGQAIPYGAITHSEFQRVQRLQDYVRPNQLYQMDVNDPLALIAYPEVLRGSTAGLPKAIIVTPEGLKENTEGIKHLYHPDIEKEALQSAILANYRRGFLNRDYTHIDEIYRFMRETAADLYEQFFKLNLLTGSESQPLSQSTLATFAKDKNVTFENPALFYTTIVHEDGGTVMEAVVVAPDSWEKESENVRDLHGGYFADTGTFEGESENVFGTGHLDKGIRKVKHVTLQGDVVHHDGLAPKASKGKDKDKNKDKDKEITFKTAGGYDKVLNRGKWTGSQTEIDCVSLEVSPGSLLATGNTLVVDGKIHNKGATDLEGMLYLANDAEFVNERIQHIFKKKVKIKKKEKKYCGAYNKKKVKTKVFTLKEAMDKNLSGYCNATGYRTGTILKQTTPNDSDNPLPTILEPEGDILEGKLRIYEWVSDYERSNFLPFIETEEDYYALYLPEGNNRKDIVRILNAANVPCIQDLKGMSVSFKVLEQTGYFNDEEYSLASIVEILSPKKALSLHNALNASSTGVHNQDKTNISVLFRNFVEVTDYDKEKSPSDKGNIKTIPVKKPPVVTLTKRLDRHDSILDAVAPSHSKKTAPQDVTLDDIFPHFVADPNARCKGLTNRGGTVLAGNKGMDMRFREAILSIPLVDIELKKYFSSKKGTFNSVKVSGAVEAQTVHRPGMVSGAHTTLISDKTATYMATDIIARKQILLQSKDNLDLAAKLITVKLPPKVSKNKALLTITNGTMEMGFVTKVVSAEESITAISTEGRVIGKAPVISGCGTNVVEGAKGTHIDVLKLNQQQTSTTSGYSGALNYIDQKKVEKHQTCLQPVLAPKDKVRKITKENGDIEEVIEEGEIIFKTLDGDILLSAPEMHGNIILKPINGDGKIDSVILEHSEKITKKTYSVNFWGKAALEKALNGEKPGSVMNSLARESSFLSAAGDLCVSKDAQGALASGLKAAYETYQTLEALNAAKSLMEFGIQQIANVGVSFGKSTSKEKRTTAVKPQALNNRDVTIISDDNHTATSVGLEGEVRDLTYKGKNVAIKSPEEKFNKKTKDASVGVNYNIATNSVSVNASMAKGKQRGLHHAHGALKVTGTTQIQALDLVTVAAPVETKHLNLEAKRLLIQDKQNEYKSSSKSGGVNAGMSGGGASFSSSKTDILEVKQSSGFKVSHTAITNVEDKTTFEGGIHVTAENAVSKPCRDAHGNPEQPLYEIYITPDGDCALTCLGLNRAKAINQLKENILIDPVLRKLIRKDINDLISEAESKGGWTIPNVTGTEVYKAWFQDHEAAKQKKDELEQRRIEALQQGYLLQPEICTAFIKRIYEDEKKWFSYNMLDALANINGFHVRIKRLSAAGTFDTYHEFKGGTVARILLHTMAGTEGGFYSEKDPLGSNLNHFSLLSTQPSVFRSPEIEWHDMKDHKKSKSTSGGIQVSPGAAIPGTASFAHNKRDARTKHLPTISANTDVETPKDISGMNRDADNTSKKTKDSKTHVEAFVPLMNPMDAPKLWNAAVDNAKGIADKPLMTPPVETVAPPQIVRKEEPEDTSITDAEADAIMDDLAERAALMAAREKKPQSKNTVIEEIDTQQWTANLKNEILKQRKMTPENAGHLAEEIVANYKKYRAEGKNHNQALEATQKKTSESCEKMYNQHQAQKSLNAYEVGLQPAAFPLVAAPIMAPALMVEIGAFMTAIAVSCKLTEETPKNTKSNSPYVNAPPHMMDAAPSGPGADFSDKGFEIHTPEPVIHITPIADALPALGGYEAAPQEFLNGIPEGFTKVDLPDTFILTNKAHSDPTQKMYKQNVAKELPNKNQARREAMRQAGIPTSQQPSKQFKTDAGYQYEYEMPKTLNGTHKKIVTDQTTDRVAGHGPHWEAGKAKNPERTDPLGRLRVENSKSKVDYIQ